MEIQGFGKYSGPSNPPEAQNPFGHFPRLSSPSPLPHRSPVNYSDLDAPEVIRSAPLSSERNLSTRNPSRPLPGFQNRSDLPSSNKSFSNPYGPYRGQSPPLGFQNNHFVGDQHPHNEVISRSDLPSSNKSFSSPYRGQSLPLGFQNNHFVGGQHPHSEFGSRSDLASSNKNFSSPYRGQSPPSGFQNNPFVGGQHPQSEVQHRSDLPLNSKSFSGSYRGRSPPSGFQDNLFVSSQHSHSEVQQRPFSSPMWGNQPKSINGKSTQLGMPSVLTASTPQPAHMFQNKSADGPLQKRARSPTLTSNRGPSPDRSVFSSGAHKRSPVDYTDLDAPDAMPSLPLAVERSSFSSRDSRPFAGTQEVPAVKKTKLPIVSSSVLGFQENLDSADEIERELHAKAKRLARFKDELREPVNPTIPSKKQHQSISEKPKFPENLKMDVTEDFTGGNADYEGGASLNSIIGLCSDMCPESERAERQRKGDLDHYERLDGDRNTSSESLAVKKYNRTAEREAELIRPMPILQKTMDYLLNLLDQPYGDKFLGLYNFLWDRMRAIRMDLRMQHLFNREAIAMLEQMIRLHIVAMHELCEYTKGEGFSEGFDAHLNIEQMNKTSVELFQFYDDHRKKGIHVHSEREFRGYYALLKLDKHPGYKVEPAELSLDLAKMTPEMRQSPEVIFARDVARACRTGNFIAFFRLVRKSSYLQACLMHAHFSKLRTQALASLHSGLQNNQGIPMHQVAKWLGMEEEDTENLLEYYGFSVKDFEEPYMVKENAFMNADSDFPVKRSKLVERKRSRAIASDVSSPSLTDICGTEKLNEPWLKKDPISGHPKLKSLSPVFSLNQSDGISSKFIPPVTTSEPTDEEMNDSITISSPKRNIQKPVYKTSHDEMMTQHKVQVTPVPLVLDFPKSFIGSHENMVESPPKPNYSPIFRNSFGRTIRRDMDATTPMTLVTSEEKSSPRSPRSPVLASDSVMNTSFPQHVFAVNLEIEEQTCSREEEDKEEGKSDEETTDYYDEEIAVAKIKLILRLWKRRTAKKRELRERKLLAANAALSSLSLGPPIWQYEVQPGNYGTFNIDTLMSERREIQERSWSLMNPSDVVATKLSEKNPDAKCLCWKMILCSQGEATPSAADSWLHSKLIPSNTADNPDLLVSYHDLAIWKKWSPSHSSNDRICCLSVIKSCKFDDLNKEIAGTSAILFLLSENSPLEEQKNRLLDFIMSFPYGSRLPLLIISSLSKNESDSATISEELELHHIDKSRVIMSHIIFLKDQKMKNMDGFFSSERLEEGLKWLAIESPPQIVIHEIKTRELVFSHLNPTLDILDEMNQAGPDCIILAFNEVLDRSMKRVAEAANANPTGWPCPEIGLIEKSSNEYLAAVLYLPSIGWSSVSRTEAFMSALNDSKLPTFKDDLSWLSTGLNNSDGIETQKLRLENCLIEYLTETSRMMGVVVAQKKARGIIQKCTGLELHNSRFYIIPKWVQIFRSIFNLWLVNLTNAEVSSTYVLVQDDFSAPGNDLEFRVSTFLPSHIVSPSFDELVEVCYNTYELESVHMDYQEVRSLSPMSSDVPMSIDNAAILTNYDCFVTGVNTEVEMVDTMKTSPEADRLSEMLKKCDIMQNMIDKKLSIYF